MEYEVSRSERREEQKRKRRILIVDDDLGLCTLVAEFLSDNDFSVHSVHNGRAGVVRALSGFYDLVLLDIMLPLQDGFEALSEVRSQSSIPIILLTARAAEQDRIAGLNGGADDYLTKPFDPGELLARIRIVLRLSE